MSVEGWKIFRHLPDFKKTFILPEGNTCIRVQKHEGVLYFCHIDFKMHPEKERTRGNDGELYWILVYVKIDEGEMAEHWFSADGKRIAPFLYTLMCFVELCDNEIVVVEPKRKYGTQKTGKIINILPFPITVINNNWNITTVSKDGFPVIGHLAIRWTGTGRGVAKLVYIEPYMKEGYTRTAGKLIDNQK